MAGPKPDNIYTPYNTGAQPDVDSPAGHGPHLDVHATPEEMGANVGSSLQHAGGDIEKVGNEEADVAIRQQGMIAETLATQAGMNFDADLGKLKGNFKSQEGLAAQASLPQFEKDVLDLKQKYRSTLMGGAQHAYDSITNRNVGYALSEANEYSAQQIKSANTTANKSGIAMAIQNAGDSGVASDDSRFGNELGDIHHFLTAMMQTEGWDQGTGMAADKNGRTTFDDSPRGKQAQSILQSYEDNYVGKAWENRLKSLANQNVPDAYSVYQKNRSQIPGSAQVAMDGYFTPKIRDVQSRDISENALGQKTAEYRDRVYGGVDPNNIGNVKTKAGSSNNTPEFNHYATPQDGVTGTVQNLRENYQGMTLQQIGAKWAPSADGNKPSDWIKNVSSASGIAPDAVPNLNDPTVLQNLVRGIGTAENVNNVGRFTPDIISQGVQSALAGNKPSMLTPPNGKLAPSIADYYRSNYSDILSNARDQAQKLHPDDIEFAEKAETKTKQRLDNIISQQHYAVEASQNSVLQAVNGDLTKGSKPATIEQLQAISPDVKKAWDDLIVNNPKAAGVIEQHMVGTQQNGKLGQGFSYLQQDAYNGKVSMDDLLYHVGDDLTQEGFNKLREVIKGQPTAEKKSENDQMATFLKYGHERILHSSLFRNTPEAEESYQSWFSSVSKDIQEKQSKGASLSSLIDPNSKDYVGGNISQFAIPVQKQLSDRADRINNRLQTAEPLSQDRMRLPGETPEAYWARVGK